MGYCTISRETLSKQVVENLVSEKFCQKAADKAFEDIGISKDGAEAIKCRLLKTKQVEEAHLKCCITNSTEDCDVLILKALSYQFKAKSL